MQRRSLERTRGAKMKQKETYDRKTVGKRMQSKRKQLGWTRKAVAERLGLVEKYYADIERGSCGMSVETLLAVTKLYGFTIDGLIYGTGEESHSNEKSELLLKNLESLPGEAQDYCLQMLFLFMKGIRTGNAEDTATKAGQG